AVEPRWPVVRVLCALLRYYAGTRAPRHLWYFGCRWFRAIYGHQRRAGAISLSVHESPIGSQRNSMDAFASGSPRILGGHRRDGLAAVGWECPALSGGGSGLCPRLAGICSADAAPRSSRSGGVVNHFIHRGAAMLAFSPRRLLRNATAVLGR